MTTVFIQQQGNHVVARTGDDTIVTVLYHTTVRNARALLGRRKGLRVL